MASIPFTLSVLASIVLLVTFAILYYQFESTYFLALAIVGACCLAGLLSWRIYTRRTWWLSLLDRCSQSSFRFPGMERIAFKLSVLASSALLVTFATLYSQFGGILLLVFTIVWACCLAGLVLCQIRAMRQSRQNEELAEGEEKEDQEDEEIMSALRLPTKFSYAALEVATQGFATLLGKGGSGSVYEGRIQNGIRVAVKKLDRAGEGHKEFYAEVATIAHIHHVNLVRLLGFCIEGNHRLLVYEFVENGSLDKWLFRKNQDNETPRILDWGTRVTICLETARALAYLHEECEEKILHLDVKPQNILLDRDFRVKVGDFGLSRSIGRDESRIVTTMRGTPGYLAPEWLRELGVSNKSDVFSYGMVLLELVSGRKNVDHSADSSNWYFPKVACSKAREDKVHEIIDSALGSSVDQKQARRLLWIAFWCIQEIPEVRPTMAKVVQMLEGNVDIIEPPLSTMFSNVSWSDSSNSLSHVTITVDQVTPRA
eukprot:c29267_g1_i3 orf=82-1539(+)